MGTGAIDWAMATLCCDGFGDEDFVFAFEHMPALGVRKVEFNCWYPRNLTPEGIESIRARCRTAGLTPASLHVPGFTASSRAELTREVARWSWLVEAASSLGIGLLKATGSERNTGGGLDGLIAILQYIAPIAATRGIRIALENHYNNVLEFTEDYDEVFAVVPDENVGLCLDTGHFAASGVDPVTVLHRFADRLIHVDLKDCASSGAEDFVPFGRGIVDFPAVREGLLEVGYSGLVLVEFPRRSLDVMHDDLRDGIAIAKSITG